MMMLIIMRVLSPGKHCRTTFQILYNYRYIFTVAEIGHGRKYLGIHWSLGWERQGVSHGTPHLYLAIL